MEHFSKRMALLALTLFSPLSNAATEILCAGSVPHLIVSIALEDKESLPETKEYNGHTELKAPGVGSEYESVYSETSGKTEIGFVRSFKSVLKTTPNGETKIELAEIFQNEGGSLIDFKGVFQFGSTPSKVGLKCKRVEN